VEGFHKPHTNLDNIGLKASLLYVGLWKLQTKDNEKGEERRESIKKGRIKRRTNKGLHITS
jgi:hypothetical protein